MTNGGTGVRDPVDIGSDRQLFVDDYWIDRIDGARRRLHRPTARETAIAIDRPWERGGVSYLNTFPDEGVYRGWYRCDPVGFRGSDNASFTAYAESDDGIHWRQAAPGSAGVRGRKGQQPRVDGARHQPRAIPRRQSRREGRRAVQGLRAGEAGAVRHRVAGRHPLAEDARGAGPDRLALRQPQHPVLGLLAGRVRGLHARRCGDRPVPGRRALDTPHHVRQLPRLDRARRHRHRRNAG